MSMFRPTLTTLALGLMMAAECFSGAPVATVSSTDAILVDGMKVLTGRITSFPLNAENEIATQTAPARVRFTDGTIVTLQRNSRMKLAQGERGVEVKILAG